MFKAWLYWAGLLCCGSLLVFLLLLSSHLSHYTSPVLPGQPLPGQRVVIPTRAVAGGWGCPGEAGGTEEPRGRGGWRQHPRVPC